MHMNQQKYNVVEIIREYVPDYNPDIADLKLQEITAVLYDGLAYGNWPKTEFTISNQVKQAEDRLTRLKR